MQRYLWALVLVCGLGSAWGQSHFYKMRNGQSITAMGNELVTSTNLLCDRFHLLQAHFDAMTQQRESSSDFTTVAQQWGTLDPTTNAISETVAEGMYTELNSFIGNGGPSLTQWCARIRQ